MPFQAYRKGDKESNTLLHFANYTQEDRHYGLPDWRGCIPDIELDYYAALYNQKFFINSGIPDLVIIVEGGQFDEDTEKKVVSFFQANFKGIENAHRTLYLPVNSENIKVRFEKLTVDQKDRDGSFEKLRAQCRDNIVSAHGVPPRLIGVVTSGQLGGSGEVHGQLRIFKEITIEPRQSLFEMKLSPVTDEMIPGTKIEFQEMDVSIQEKDSDYYPAMVQAGILDVDEAREELGYPPFEEKENQTEKSELRLVKTLESMRKSL